MITILSFFFFTEQGNKAKKYKLLYLERKPHQLKLVFMRVLSPGGIKIWKCWFLLPEGGDWRTRRKTLGARREQAKNLTHIMTPGPGIEPEP